MNRTTRAKKIVGRRAFIGATTVLLATGAVVFALADFVAGYVACLAAIGIIIVGLELMNRSGIQRLLRRDPRHAIERQRAEAKDQFKQQQAVTRDLFKQQQVATKDLLDQYRLVQDQRAKQQNIIVQHTLEQLTSTFEARLARFDEASASLNTGLTTGLKDVNEHIRALDDRVRKAARANERDTNYQTLEVGALLELNNMVSSRTAAAPRPGLGGWAVNPTTMLELLYLVRKHKPQRVLELGSGSSTVWLAEALAESKASLVSLDHEEEFATRTTELVKLHGLSSTATVRHAPLAPVTVGDETRTWYDTAALADLEQIDFLIVDGPPAKLGTLMRYPALSVVGPHLADSATIVLDDARRPEEQEVLERWLAETPGLTLEQSIYGTHAVLRYQRK